MHFYYVNFKSWCKRLRKNSAFILFFFLLVGTWKWDSQKCLEKKGNYLGVSAQYIETYPKNMCFDCTFTHWNHFCGLVTVSYFLALKKDTSSEFLFIYVTFVFLKSQNPSKTLFL